MNTTAPSIDHHIPIPAIIAARYRTTCQTCGKVYSYPSQLRRHHNSHVKRCSHRCAACGSTFTDISNARRCAARGCATRVLTTRVRSRRNAAI
jgi:DNA-directed RNA polymerase subunit RPC12/RpoP